MEPVSVWEGDTLLECFLKNAICDHKPRATTGRTDCKKMGNVVTVEATESLESIFKKLSVEGFSSAPVCRGRTLAGHITLLDLVRHVNGLFFGTTQKDWVDWWDKQLRFQLAQASSILPAVADQQSPYPTMNKHYTSFSALEMMARNRNHQILQLDDNGKICGILTQSMLISFLRQLKAKWGDEFRSLKVEEFVDLQRPENMVKVGEDEMAINAFLKMDESNIHGLPIVDRHGTLTGCISVRDLKGCGTDGSKFSRLYETVKTFKRMVQNENARLAPKSHYSQTLIPAEAIYVTPGDTMEEVIRKMDDGNLHRVFVCSESSAARGQPVVHGVISQSDVLRQALDCMIESAGQAVAERRTSRAVTRHVWEGKAGEAEAEAEEREGKRKIAGAAKKKAAPMPKAMKRSIPIAFA